jgi:hypothetical protein
MQLGLFILLRFKLFGGANNIMIKISNSILTLQIQERQEMLEIYRTVGTWISMDVSCFLIGGEDFSGKRRYIYRNDIITKKQYRMLIVKFIPFEDREEPFILNQIEYKNLIRFDIANEDGNMFDSVMVNEQLKLRILKKILKFRDDKSGELHVINYLNEIIFNDYSQLEHFHQYLPLIQIKFYQDNSKDINIKYKNGEFKYQICIKDNFKNFKKKLCEIFI